MWIHSGYLLIFHIYRNPTKKNIYYFVCVAPEEAIHQQEEVEEGEGWGGGFFMQISVTVVLDLRGVLCTRHRWNNM